jgi:hypothetical protein
LIFKLLFNDALEPQSLYNVESDKKIFVNDEYVRIRKKTIVISFKVGLLFRHSRGLTNHENLSYESW